MDVNFCLVYVYVLCFRSNLYLGWNYEVYQIVVVNMKFIVLYDCYNVLICIVFSLFGFFLESIVKYYFDFVVVLIEGVIWYQNILCVVS